MEEHEMEQLRAAMQNRYGLELPELASQAPPTESGPNQNTKDENIQSESMKRQQNWEIPTLNSTNKEDSRDTLKFDSTGAENDGFPRRR